MRALTIRQPWASLIATGAKTIETRPWRTDYRGPVLIHAGAHRPATFWHHHGDDDVPPSIDRVSMSPYWEWTEDVDDYTSGGAYRWIGPLGAVVAVATLRDIYPIHDVCDVIDTEGVPVVWADDHCLHVEHDEINVDYLEDERHFGDYTGGRWAWLLDNVRPLPTPVPAKGKQGLWRPSDMLTHAVSHVLRECLVEHQLVEFTTTGSKFREFMCSRCGEGYTE